MPVTQRDGAQECGAAGHGAALAAGAPGIRGPTGDRSRLVAYHHAHEIPSKSSASFYWEKFVKY